MAIATDRPPAGRLSQTLDKVLEALSSPKGFYTFVTTTLILLYLGRVLSFPGTGGDDAEQFLFSQVFSWGYDIRNPALYTWLVIAVNEVFGISIAGIELLKFSLLWLTYVLLFHAARQVLTSKRYAALAALSPMAIYYVAWDAAMGYSHSVLLVAACAATYVVLLRLDRRGDMLSYGLLGMVLATGVLAKYGYVLFAAAFVLAFLLDPWMRGRLLNWRILVTLGVTTALLAPHLIWMYDWVQSHPGGLDSRLAQKFSAPGVESHFKGAAIGLWDMMQSFAGFFMPLLLLLVIFFPRAFIRLPQIHPAQNHPAQDRLESTRHRRNLGYFVVFLLLLIAAMVIATGTARVRTHYMYIFILVPIYFFARVETVKVAARASARYAASLAALALVVVITMPTKAFVDSLICSKCALQVPYGEFAETLRGEGFVRGTIIGFYHPYDLAGNFRVHFPDSRVISIKHPDFIVPAKMKPEPCLLLWTPKYRGNVIHFATKKMGVKLANTDTVGSLIAPLSGRKNREIRLDYILLPKAAGCS